MKTQNSTKIIQAALAGLLLLMGAPALAYDFALGSNGTDGALDVTSNQVVALPADGVLHYTTVNVAEGATLSFSYSGSFHPGVVILATGDVIINGTIDISGEDGTASGPGAGGPGGGRGGSGAASSPSHNSGFLVSDLDAYAGRMALRPLGGNGGYGFRRSTGLCTSPLPGGGGGGGALVIISNTAIRSSATASIDASGGSFGPTGGVTGCTGFSIGASEAGNVRLMAPTVDAASLHVTAVAARTSAFEFVAVPTSSPSPMQTGSELVPFPASLPTALITHIDGTAVEASTLHMLPATTSSVTVTVLVTGCSGSNVEAHIYAYNSSSGKNSSASLGSAATGSDSINVEFTNLDPTQGFSYALYSRAVCAAP